MATAQIQDPYSNFNFLVEIDGITRAAFQECSGLEISNEPTEYREGGTNTTVRKLPGITKYSNITLKWGMTDDIELYEWLQNIVRGDIERKTGSIVLLDRKGGEVKRWNFVSAWPTKWNGPDFNATSNEVAIETLEIAHEGLELA